MKITDPQVIKNGEKDLIASVQEDLDPETIKQILKERMAVATMAHTGGQIVVHDNEIAFRLDFEVNLNGSLLFDRDGNLIEEQLADESGKKTTDTDEVEPDMDLDDLDDGLEGLEDIAPAQNLTGDPEDDLTAPTDDLSIDLPEYDLEDDLEDDLVVELDDKLDELIDENNLNAEGPDDKNPPPKDLDDDINDILKESREFWEQKEDS